MGLGRAVLTQLDEGSLVMFGWARRAAAVVVVSTVAIGIATTAAAASLASGTVNGIRETPTGVPRSSQACTIADDSGNPTTAVTIAVRQGADTVYWVDFTVPNPATPPTQATVSIKQTPPGFWSDSQKIVDIVGGDFYIVPFAVPEWGGNSTVGNFSVKVKYNNHVAAASCSFSASMPATS
jgi:hypothetical protein